MKEDPVGFLEELGVGVEGKRELVWLQDSALSSYKGSRLCHKMALGRPAKVGMGGESQWR